MLQANPRALDLRLLLREAGPNLIEMPEPQLYARACDHGWGFACARIAGVRQMVRPRDPNEVESGGSRSAAVLAALGISGRLRNRCRFGASGGRRRVRPFLAAEALPGFVEIPAGPFVMGSDPALDPMANDNERWSSAAPQGTVDVPAFFIARQEVTIAQFQAFVEATKFKVDDRALRGQPNHPVAFVSWPDALAYGRWLEATLKARPDTPSRLRQLLRDGWRVSLPSEAQWEKAARGTDRRIFPWGNQPRRDRANYQSTGTTPVGGIRVPRVPVSALRHERQRLGMDPQPLSTLSVRRKR